MRVLILASSTGLSHLARCLELARYLRRCGLKVDFACGHGPWSALARAYGFAIHEIAEPTLSRPAFMGVGRPSTQGLLASFRSECRVIERLRPDIVVSDWRFTALFSASATGIPCAQIWNSNWGALAGLPITADPQFRAHYNRLWQRWSPEYDHFLGIVRGKGLGRREFPFRGSVNLVPDCRPLRQEPPKRRLVGVHWIGPLVPMPKTWPATISNQTSRFFRIALALGGHQSDEVCRRTVALVRRRGCEVMALPTGPPARTAPQWSFFPRCLLSADAVLCHGGSGTIYQSLLSAKPLLVLPRHIEQLDNGLAVERLGVGTCVKQRRPTDEELEAALDRVLDPTSRDRACKVAASLRRHDPFREAYIAIREVL